MKINKKTIILQSLALLMLTWFAAACSNIEDGFHVADRSNLKLFLDPRNYQASKVDSILSIINAVNGADTVYVKCPANWKVEVSNNRPEGHSEWTLYVSDPQTNERGRFFTFSSTNNISKDQRFWQDAIKVYVEGHDGEQLVPAYLSVRQNKSVVQLDHDSFEIFPAAGGGGSITVTSNDPDWSVTSNVQYTGEQSNGWIDLQRDGDTVNFTVMANRGTSVRSGSIQFLDGSGKVVADVNITQSESTNIFDAALVGMESNLISHEGDTIGVNVLSDGRWRVECAQAGNGGWLTIKGIGEVQEASIDQAGGTGKQIEVIVAENKGEDSREATLAFSRVDDPATDDKGGVAPIFVKIVQEGTRQPAFSEIWFGNVYTQDYVEIFGRYSTGANVTGRGFEITNVTKGTGPVLIKNLTGVDNESESPGYIHVKLVSEKDNGDLKYDYSGLTYEAANEYLIRSYVVVGSDTIISPTYKSLIAPGTRPDNSTQSKPDVQ